MGTVGGGGGGTGIPPTPPCGVGGGGGGAGTPGLKIDDSLTRPSVGGASLDVRLWGVPEPLSPPPSILERFCPTGVFSRLSLLPLRALRSSGGRRSGAVDASGEPVGEREVRSEEERDREREGRGQWDIYIATRPSFNTCRELIN